MAAHVVGSFEHFAAAGNGAGELLRGRSWARGEAGNYWGTVVGADRLPGEDRNGAEGRCEIGSGFVVSGRGGWRKDVECSGRRKGGGGNWLGIGG